MGVSARAEPPVPYRTALLRPRLLKRLLARFDQRVTSVTAGAGFGKTVLLVQAVAENRLSPRGVDVWLSCEPQDQDVGALTAGLLAGLGVKEPGEAGSPRSAAGRIAAQVRWHAPAEVVFVLDDLHQVGVGTPGAALVNLLVDELPANGHLVLCGREQPPAPLARLQAQGRASHLGESDLAFTEDELTAFAELRDISPRLLAATAGWPAVAELTASMGHASAIRFLWEELLAGLPVRDREVLAGLVAVGGADGELARAVFGDAQALAPLTTLPLISRTAEGWCVPHALWEPVVADVMPADAVAEVRRRAGLALAERGDVPAAMRLLVGSEHWADARRLIRGHLCTRLGAPSDLEMLTAWYVALPAQARDTPEGLLLRAASLRASDPAASARLHAEAAAGFRAADDAEAEVAALLSRLLLCFWQGDTSGVLSAVPRLRELGEQGSALALSGAQVFDALLAPDLQTGLTILDRVAVAEHSAFAAFVDWHRALYLLALGRPDQAEPWARRAYRALPTEASAALIEVLRCTGRIAAAEQEAATLLAGRLGPPTTRQYAVAIALLAFTGRPDEARRHLPAARASGADAPAMHWISAALALAEAAVTVAVGDEQTAADLLGSGLAAVPLGLATLRRIHEGFVALSYVLLPQMRPLWDAEPMDGTTQQVRALARALVSMRETGVPRGDLPALDAAAVRGLLPRPWLVELAVGRQALGRPDGARLLDELGPPIRPTVRALANSRVKRLANAASRLLGTLPAAPKQVLTINVLGTLEILHDGLPAGPDALRRQRVRQFLSYLVAEPLTTRDAVAAALWPDFDEVAARNNLKVTLTYTQRLLEPSRDEEDPPYYLRATGSRLRLWHEGLHVDAWQFDKLVDAAADQEKQGSFTPALDAYLQALALYRGDFLAEAPPAGWIDVEQQRLRARFVAAAVRAGELLIADGVVDEAHRLAVRAIRADPWSEPAHRLTIAAYLAAGDRSSARRALQRCYAALQEMDAEPHSKTLMLARRLAG